MWSNRWIKGQDYPEWADADVYKKTITGGYLFNGETPKQAYRRVADTIAMRLKKPDMADKFFDYIWNGWLCLASPVLSNTGTERGLPISCFGIDVADSIYDIGKKNLEMMLLAKHGGGVGVGINQIRPAGSDITMNGTSDGIVPFCKIYDSSILATNQGAVRRGAASVNLNIEHADWEDWLEIREPKGDVNRQSLNLHQCAIIGDKFMRKLRDGDKVGKLVGKGKGKKLGAANYKVIQYNPETDTYDLQTYRNGKSYGKPKRGVPAADVKSKSWLREGARIEVGDFLHYNDESEMMMGGMEEGMIEE